jgi:hypothetical protein
MDVTFVWGISPTRVCQNSHRHEKNPRLVRERASAKKAQTFITQGLTKLRQNSRRTFRNGISRALSTARLNAEKPTTVVTVQASAGNAQEEALLDEAVIFHFSDVRGCRGICSGPAR